MDEMCRRSCDFINVSFLVIVILLILILLLIIMRLFIKRHNEKISATVLYKRLRVNALKQIRLQSLTETGNGGQSRKCIQTIRTDDSKSTFIELSAVEWNCNVVFDSERSPGLFVTRDEGIIRLLL